MTITRHGARPGTDLAESTESARECSRRGLQPTRKDELAWLGTPPIPTKPRYDPDRPSIGGRPGGAVWRCRGFYSRVAEI